MTNETANDPGKDMGWLDDEEFYNVMQSYRHAPITNPSIVVDAFEAVKELVRFKVGLSKIDRGRNCHG